MKAPLGREGLSHLNVLEVIVTQRTRVVAALGLVLFMRAPVAHAGDWRELIRKDGYSIGYNAHNVVREGDQLTVEVITALLPERQLPLYGISSMKIDCETRYVIMGAFQFYIANGDPFGQPTDEKPIGAFGDDEDMTALCANGRPSEPGADSALAYFKALYVNAP